MRKNIFSLFALSVSVLLVVIGVIVLTPTEYFNLRNVEFVNEQLYRDLSISNQVKYLSGKFKREPIIIYRLLDEAIDIDKYSVIKSESQRCDCVKMISEKAKACGVEITPSSDDLLYAFYGSDYSVLYMKSKANSYLIYLGAQ